MGASAMCKALLAAGLLLAAALGTQAQTTRFEGVGRAATPAEVKAWDIDVRPDFKGLPPGQGSVKRGEQVWEAQCASCHGTFGESNDVFTPLVGFTTPQDTVSGRVANLLPGANAPTRTTMMKLSQLSTLWDYISRAMPWTAPKSLPADDVYAVVAFMLNLANVVPEDFVLNQSNVREVQQRLPNRNGMSQAHALWPGREFGGTRQPDVQGSACMKDCATEIKVASFIPAYARNAHGNLADQSRHIGPTRGAQTSAKNGSNEALALVNTMQDAAKNVVTKGASSEAEKTPEMVAGPGVKAADLMPALQKNVCVACHAVSAKLVGPSFRDIAARYKDRSDAEAYLSDKIKRGSQGVWGGIPMPPQSIPEADARRVAQWLAAGAAP